MLLDGRTVQAFGAQPASSPCAACSLKPRRAKSKRSRAGNPVRTQRFGYQLLSLTKPGSFKVSGEAGWQPGKGLAAAINTNVLIAPQFTAQLSGEVLGARRRLGVAAYYASLPGSLAATTAKSSLPALSQNASVSADLSTAEDGRFSACTPPATIWRLAVVRQGSTAATPRAVIFSWQPADGAGLGRTLGFYPQLPCSAKPSTVCRRSGGAAAVQWQNERASATLSGEANSKGRLRLSVQGRYRIDDVSSLSAGVAASTAQIPAIRPTPAPRWNTTGHWPRPVAPELQRSRPGRGSL